MLNLSIVLPLKYPIAFNKSALIALFARKNEHNEIFDFRILGLHLLFLRTNWNGPVAHSCSKS